MLVACAVIYVDCYAAQCRDFGCEFIEARVILLFAFVGGHFGLVGPGVVVC